MLSYWIGFIAIFTFCRAQRQEYCPGCVTITSGEEEKEAYKELEKYLEFKGYALGIGEMKGCTKQVVSGIKYTCEFESKNICGTYGCKVEFVIKAWTNTKYHDDHLRCYKKVEQYIDGRPLYY
uniref:Proteasome subunit beta n=1 Tax=Lygus hesperus TaxID=30085 RepID=A0A0A9YVD8_LYGHE